MKGELIENITKFNVVVITEMMSRKKLEQIDEICRKNKIAFIYSSILGLSGFDFGPEHNILDDNGEECKTYVVKLIENNGCVTIDGYFETGVLMLNDGDFVKFREVGGMTQLNDGKPREIKIISETSFKVVNEDFNKYPEYTNGGFVEQVKIPKKYHYKSLKERFINFFDEKPIDPLDLTKFGRNELLYITFLALNEYFSKNNSLPELNNKSQANEIVKRTKKIYDNNFKLSKEGKLNWFSGVQEWDEKIPSQVAFWAKAEISSVCSILGGIVAQEIVKFTGKYIPINQWLTLDFFETVESLGDNVDRNLKNSRYDEQIAIYGNEIQKKIENSNIFIIGAGGLGCEYLKNFALMGMSTSKGKEVIVTDNNNIKMNNLNTQFLFRKTDIGKSKSKLACISAKKINPLFNPKDLQSFVLPINEHIFNEEFWNSKTFIINSINSFGDNIKSSKYIDSQCTIYGKCLIDSGTYGTKAHIQSIIPHVTSCYNDNEDLENCEMRNRRKWCCPCHSSPVIIEHCMNWGRNTFDYFFTNVIKDIKALLKDQNKFYSDLKMESGGNINLYFLKLKFVIDHIILVAEQNIDKLIEFAIKQYTENFCYNIKQILFHCPENYTHNDGTKLWRPPLKIPQPIPYNPDDPQIFLFIKNYIKILSRALSIKGDLSDARIKEVSRKTKISPFVPKNKKGYEEYSDFIIEEKKIVEKKAETEKKDESSSIIKELNIYIKKILEPEKIKSVNFEKYDDCHIDFIHICSNLRARNFKIKEYDKIKTKIYAGKIIPTLVTTTFSIAGIVILQLYTLYQTNKIDFIRDCHLNLGINCIILSEPRPVIKMQDKEIDPILLGPVKAIPPSWTVWDKITINKSMTCKELIDYILEKYNVEVSIISAGNVTIIQTFMTSSKNIIDQKIEDIYNNKVKVKLHKKIKCLYLNLSGDIGEATALMPLFKYIFKN